MATSNVANSTLTTNFDVSPYYDDYNVKNQYYRVLFKPGFSVQSRELTQMQTMLQSQIKRMGVNVFKEGSLVIPGQFTFRVNVGSAKGSPIDYIKIEDKDKSNSTVSIASFLGETVTGANTGIRAHVTNVLDTDGTTANPKTLYVTYLGASPSNSQIRVFQAGETLINANAGTCIVSSPSTVDPAVISGLSTQGGTDAAFVTSLYQVLLNRSPDSDGFAYWVGQLANGVKRSTIVDYFVGSQEYKQLRLPTGYASLFRIEEGVLFAKDHFIWFPTQEAILSRYNPSPTCKVGFFITEQIVNASQDASLLDPALESSNFSAPGADRLKLVATLSVMDYNFQETNDFITLFTMQNGVLRISNDRTQYNVIGDTMASRTYDESGDYVVRGFNVQVSESQISTYPVPNNGRYYAGNSSNLIVSVDAGHGYVKGYPVTNYDKYEVEIPKATTYANSAQQVLSTAMGSYVTVNELVGCWQADQGTLVKLFDTANKRITNGGASDSIKWSVGTTTGNQIGFAYFNAIEFVDGTPGFDANYNVYLSDINLFPGYSFGDVRSLFIKNSNSADAGADVVLSSVGGLSLTNFFANYGSTNVALSTIATSSPTAVLEAVSSSPLFFYSGSKSVKTMRNPDGTPSVSYYYNKTEGVGTSLSMSSTGNVTINLLGSTNELFPYGTVQLSDTDVRQDLVLSSNETFNIGPLWSAATVTGSGLNLYGASTHFTRLNVGDKLEFSGISNTYYITSITDDYNLTLSAPLPTTNGNSWITGNTVFKAYKTGDIIDLTGVGLDSGANRTVSATPTSLTLNLKETLPKDVGVTLTYKLFVSGLPEATKSLRSHRFVKIDCSQVGTTGPFYLGFSDVFAIRNVIRKTGAPPTSLTDGNNVTSYFVLNNGQKDTHYDIGFINKSGSLTLASNDYLLVELDYFFPNYTSKGGYFTVDSYPIDDTAVISNETTIRTENVPVYVSQGSNTYDLRNYVDFRPVKKNTAADSTDPSTATTNPAYPSTGTISLNDAYSIIDQSYTNADFVNNLYNKILLRAPDSAGYTYWFNQLTAGASRLNVLSAFLNSTEFTSGHPSPISSYYSSASGLRFPVPSSELNYRYSYYLGRSDIIVMTKDNTLTVVSGVPGVNPATPVPLDTQMLIATIDVAPYPSLSPYFANKLTRRDLACVVTKNLVRGWTMKDIGGLEKRIQNLEYYASLTLLEKDATNLKILDDNGNDRFKNGIFVDTFKDTSLTAKGTNQDYRIVNDPKELSIRPLFGTDSILYDAYTVPAGTIVANNLVMFDYTPAVHFSQKRVTDYRNLERGTYLYQGNLNLTPQQDVWIDTTQLPDETLGISASGATLSISDIVGDTLTLTAANSKPTPTGSRLSFGTGASYKVNNESYFANTTIVAKTPNTRSNAVVYGGYWARGATGNAIVQILSANYINGQLATVTLQSTTGFARNEAVDVYANTNLDYPLTPYGAVDKTASVIGYTGISLTADQINTNYNCKLNMNDKVVGVTTGTVGYISSIDFDSLAGTLKAVTVTTGGSAFGAGEQVNFYYSGNNNYEKISATIAAKSDSYSNDIKPGDIVYDTTSGFSGTVVSTGYDGSTLKSVSIQTGSNFVVGDKVDFRFASNNVYKGVTATVSAVSSANPPESSSVVYTKNLVNTTWEGWKALVTGYKLYEGSGANKIYKGTFATAEEARALAATWTQKQNGGVATLETLYDNTRAGMNYFAQSSSDTAVGPNKLISSATIPYIRPQVITAQAQGLKPYSKMSVWFDGVNVTKYCMPLTPNQYNQSIQGKPITPDILNYSNTANVLVDLINNEQKVFKTITTDFIVPDPTTKMANTNCPLIVRDNGDLFFRFQISADSTAPKFRTGSRRLLITDNSVVDPVSLAEEPDASTLASAYFFADGTQQTVQRTVYSTKGFLKTSEVTNEEYKSNTDIVLPNTWTPPPPPKGHCCFDPDAKVLMADRTWKAIKDIVVGDKVIGDNGVINTVLKNKTIGVGTRDMYQFKGASFWSTDDHLFLTKKGYKTWRPDVVLNDLHSENEKVLIGDNRTTSLDDSDLLKMYEVVGDEVVAKFVPYADVAPVKGDFAADYIVHDLTLDGNMTYIVEGFVVHNCCIAYSVLINAPADEEGIFCTGYDIFVQRKSQTRKMWFEVREMDSAGQVTNSQIPGSVVYVENADIPVSTNGVDNPLHIKFPAPIFLMNGKEYAFVVHSFSPGYLTVDPDTYLWISRVGETDINTGAAVNDRMKTGTFFQTTNNKQWEPVQDVDLRIDVYRARFLNSDQPGTRSASVVLGNKPVEKLYLNNVSNSMKGQIGDFISSGDTMTFTSSNGAIAVNDVAYGKTSLVRGTVIAVNASGIRLSNTHYQVGETVDFYRGGIYNKVSGIVGTVTSSSGHLTYYNEAAVNVYSEIAGSTGGFQVGDTIVDTTAGSSYSAQIAGIDNFRYSASSLEPKVLNFNKTSIDYQMATVGNNSLTFGAFTPITPGETHYWPEEKVIYARSNEVGNLAGAPSSQLLAKMVTNSDYVSPVIDLTATHSLYIENVVNNDATGEDNKSGGNAINKYISQTITLADGQDAEDIKVYLTAYKPPGTNVLVYVKLKNNSDPDKIEQKNWIQLQVDSPGDITYSSKVNRLNFLDFTYSLPASVQTGPNGQAQYMSDNGTVYTGFKYFAVKIVILAEDPAIVPRVADLRAIALQT